MPEDLASADARPAPETMLGRAPKLDFDARAAEAANFHARAVGATDLGRMPDADNRAATCTCRSRSRGAR